MANKITTRSYFIKRLKDSGYTVWNWYDNYSESDARVWTAVIDPGGTSIWVTLFNNKSFLNETFFEIYDGNQFIPGKINLKTDSIEVLIKTLVDCNINNKNENYGKRKNISGK